MPKKEAKLYILMWPTQKLATIQIYHLTGNALNWTQNRAQNLSRRTPVTLSSPKTCVCLNCNSSSHLLNKLLVCDAHNLFLVPISSQVSPVYILTTFSCTIHLHLGLPNVLFVICFTTKTLYALLLKPDHDSNDFILKFIANQPIRDI